ncbi:MAG TPA: Ig-like domain repeat protein [Acidobacteriaceae bacterium]|nr:Ig-like domain repeat protein [Acidobacteriaceae bacterium]
MFWTVSRAPAQIAQPRLAKTGASISAIATGDTQLSGHNEILYVESPAGGSVTAGLLLSSADGFADLPQNQLTFKDVASVLGTIADIDGDGIPDFVFATSPAHSGGPELCVYYGTKTAATTGAYAISRSGCATLGSTGTKLPVFSSVVAGQKSGGFPTLYLTDTANAAVYAVQSDGRSGDGTNLVGFSLKDTYPLQNGPAATSGPTLFAASSSSRDFVVQQSESLVPYFADANSDRFTAMPPLSGTPAAAQAAPVALLMADLNGDGRQNVVAIYRPVPPPAGSVDASGNPVAPKPNQLYIWFGKSDGTFGSPQAIALSRTYSMATVADINGDGRPDIVLADDSTVGVLYQQQDHTFASDFGSVCRPCGEQQVQVSEGISSISAADIDGDGKTDVVIGSGSSSPAAGFSGAAPRVQTAPHAGGVTVVPNALIAGAPTGSVSASPDPSAVGASFTITAVVTPPANSTVFPTGTIQFKIAGTPIGSPLPLQPIANSPTFSSSTFVTINGNSQNGAGSYSLEADYSGDVNYTAAVFNGTHIIGATNGTTTNLALCIGPSPTCPSTGVVTPPYVAVLNMVYGQTFNGNAVVTKNDSNPLTGTTAFSDNGVVICTLNTASGGTCPPSVGTGLNTGQHNIVATYSGDPNHTGSTSQTVTINVTADTTTTTITGGPNPAVQGSPVTFTATVTGQYAPPTGTVTFLNGSSVIGTATLTASGSITSVATFTTSSLPVGTDQITASYGSTLNFQASASSPFAETITPQLAASFTLTVSPATLDIGVGYTGAVNVTIVSNNGFNAPVNLSCGPLPNEARCTFVNPTINGAGTTTLFIATSAPHDCNNSTPYFLGSNSGLGLRSLALPAMSGLIVFCVTGRRRWLRSLVMLAIVAGVMQTSGCGHCTDLATRPGTYTVTVNASTGGSSGQTQSQPVKIHVFI